MKKYVLLITFSVMFVIFIFVGAAISVNIVPIVQLTKPEIIEHYDFINTSGVIEEVDKTEITLEVPVVPNEVVIEIGDYIEIGEPIAKINKDETLKAIVNMGNAFSTNEYSNVFAQESFTNQTVNIDGYSDKIPDEIIAASSGTITKIDMEKGSLTEANKPIITISDLSNLAAKITINETDISKVKEGQSVILTGAGFKGVEYTGEIEKIFPTARKIQNGFHQETIVDVSVALQNIDDIIKPGFTAKAKVITSQPKAIMIIPYECIYQDDNNKEFVQIYENGKVQTRYITTGAETIQGVEIKDGVNWDELIIIGNNTPFEQNERVRLPDKLEK